MMKMLTKKEGETPRIRLTSRTVYEVSIVYTGSLNALRQREPVLTLFSNLRKAVDAISAELAINNWPPRVNYTAVYRGIKQRAFYSCDFDVHGVRMFRVKVTARVLNPALPRLGIDEHPTG
ncbi:hypothetical protein GCM10027578_13760 [Spirosoma luteolum]